MLLNVIKPSLYSKDDEVVNWGLKLLTKLTNELGNLDKLY